MDRPSLFAVAGRPVFHSLSPCLFRRGFGATGYAGLYVRLAARRAEEAFTFFRELGLRGMNVTAPFKTAMRALVDGCDEAAAAIGAVNVVVADGRQAVGRNTDHLGVVGALSAHGVHVVRRSFVVAGAGGAGRAAAYGLTNAGARVTVVNRTAERAARAAADFGCRWARLEELRSLLAEADGLVSAIGGPDDPIEAAWLRPGQSVLDAVYPGSRLARAAEERGCRVISGQAWLLHQALPAFRLFTGLEPPAEEMAAALGEGRPSGRKTANVSLVGFMGSGKSEIAAPLAALLGFRAVDLDRAVEQAEGLPVPEIFRRQGEARFREAERAQLERIELQEGSVVACGGGAVLEPADRELLAANSTVVWLHASLATCLKRIEDGTRPLLQGGDAAGAARRLMEERLPYYAQVSDLVVRSEETAEAVARLIHEEIGPSFAR